MFAKSKLNSLETLISQALIDLEISHEEFKTIVKDKEKKLWLRNKDKGEMLDVGSIYDLIDKETKGKFETKIQQMNKSENIKDMDQN